MLRKAAAIAATAALLLGGGCGGRATSDPVEVGAVDATGGAGADDPSGGARSEAGDTSGGAGAVDPSGGAGAEDPTRGAGAADPSGGDGAGAADPSGGAAAEGGEPSGGSGAEAPDTTGGTGAEPSVTGGGGSGGSGGAPPDVDPDPCAGVTTDFYFQCYGECSTWTDESTGLTWLNTSGEELLWADAPCFCDSLEADGMTDWRLPSIGELRTLITGCDATATGGRCRVTDDCLLSTCFDEALCGGCEFNGGPMDGWYLPDEVNPHLTAGNAFSSSPVEGEDGSFWGVDFQSGEVNVRSGNWYAFARCVR